MRSACLLMAMVIVLAAYRPTQAAGEEPVPTQRDWMIGLVDALGFSFGLPDEPGDEDYIKILNGDRHYRIEAEEAKQPTDMVSIKGYSTFGTFSGDGWVSGIATPTVAHLRFLLPLGGSYRISAAVRLAGHEIVIDGHSFSAEGGNRFTDVFLGEAELSAGEQEATIHLPPNGAVDYIELDAPPLPAIAPTSDWEPDRPLSRDDMAVTAARLMGLEPLLPLSGETVTVEAETAADYEGAAATDIRHLGQPSGGRWIRAGAGPARLRLPFTPPAPGVYDLLLRGESGSSLTATLNGNIPLVRTFPSYLQTLPLGTFYMDANQNVLELRLPSRGGVDSLILEGRRSAGPDYRRLAGLGMEESPPSLAEMDGLLALLAAIGPSN